jgi:hypothetical protein
VPSRCRPDKRRAHSGTRRVHSGGRRPHSAVGRAVSDEIRLHSTALRSCPCEFCGKPNRKCVLAQTKEPMGRTSKTPYEGRQRTCPARLRYKMT